MTPVLAALEAQPGGRWVTCPRCGVDDAVVILSSGDRLLGIPGTFHVVRCRRCEFLYTNPQPDDSTLARHYPAAYYRSFVPAEARPRGCLRRHLRAGVLAARSYPVRLPAPRVLWRAAGAIVGRMLAQRFLWLPPFVPGGTLLDVGCGSGGYLAEMRDLGWRVIGVEPDVGAAAAARRHLGLPVRTGTLEQANLPDACADVVVMRMVLEHTRDPRRTLIEARRILKPGGRLLVSVPNAASLEARLFGRHWFAWELPRHLSHFTPESLTALLRQAGFAAVRIRHLVNANNLSHSIRYRRGCSGAAGDPGAALRLVGALAAAVRTAGRIAAEAQLPAPRPSAELSRRDRRSSGEESA